MASPQVATVVVTMADIRRGTITATAAEVRSAIRGRDGYTTLWPTRRRGRRRRGQRRPSKTPPSVTQFRVRGVAPRSGPGRIEIRHRQAKGVLLEQRREIRGYRNIHYQAARHTLEVNWSRITTRAAADAGRRAEAAARLRARRAAAN